MSVPAVAGVQASPPCTHAAAPAISIALLGFGRVGAAVARAASEWNSPLRPLRIVGALVRDPLRQGRGGLGIDLVTDPERLFARRPDVVVEAIGGIEPALALVRTALERGLPVVTANKALIARHGEQLLALAARSGVPLRYEASVLAGVPFLGTFAARPFAARVTGITGILNGTSNFILSRMTSGEATFSEALAEAQQLGFAEADPRDDIAGVDAAHKLAVLARHFNLGMIGPDALETAGIDTLTPDDLRAARELGGTIKPVASIARTSRGVEGFVGPAFLPCSHKLASIDGVDNAVLIDAAPGRLLFSGPGAGPLATATTILDDVVEATRGGGPAPRAPEAPVAARRPSTAWVIRLRGATPPRREALAEFFRAHGVWTQATVTIAPAKWLLTYPCSAERVGRALDALSHASGCETGAIRALEH